MADLASLRDRRERRVSSVVARRFGRVGRSALLAAIACTAGASHGAAPDATAFLGTWLFQAGSTISISCPTTTLKMAADGIRTSIYLDAGGKLTFEFGCHCQLPLAIGPDGAAELDGSSQPCTLLAEGNRADAVVESLRIEATSPVPHFHLSLSGSASTSVCAGEGPFAATGEMIPNGAAGSPVFRCGDPATAVGVVPYDTAGTSFCPLGTGLEEFDVTMRTEDNPRCSAASGSAGESPWLLPDDDSTRSHQCGNALLTRLSFCRVDGALFKPITGDSDAAQYYAVLQLGTSCPNGSVSVTKHIDTEDDPDPPGANSATGFPGENAVASGDRTKTYVELHFCYFRADADPTRRMIGFPDIGIPYAVFHRFADQQPPWVMAKAWHYSQDETDAVNSNGYPGLTPDLNDFKSVIENTPNSTFYDIARVR